MHTLIENQIAIEEQYNRKHIDGYIRDELTSDPIMLTKIQQGVVMVKEYMNKEYSYINKEGVQVPFASKNNRLEQLKLLDIDALVLDIFIGVSYCLQAELFTSISAQLAGRLKFCDKKSAIATVAELMAVLCQTDAFDIIKVNKMASLCVISRMNLSSKIIKFIENSRYLPPMVCEPLELSNNYSSGYLTHSDSLILGSSNHHDGDVCIDVLNIMNKVQLQLDTQFLSTVEEEPSEITPEKIMKEAMKRGKPISMAVAEARTKSAMENWNAFKRQSYQTYLLMTAHNNRFYLTHKVDKRGRAYSSGFHINTQGAPFKKAAIELSHEELVTGVPA